MKVLLVTSEVTYLPDNGNGFLSEIIRLKNEQIAGIIMVKNISFRLACQIGAMPLAGAYRLPASLLKHAVKARLVNKKEFLGKPIIKTSSVNDPGIIQFIRQTEIDLIVHFRTREIFQKELLAAPRFGCINVHHGLLPQQKGVFCDLYALANAQPAGFTLHQMNTKIDSGQILAQQILVMPRPEPYDYQHYLSGLWESEAKEVAEVISHLETYGSLPISCPIHADRTTRFSRNPGFFDLVRLGKKVRL